jgi:hypothetical protein
MLCATCQALLDKILVKLLLDKIDVGLTAEQTLRLHDSCESLKESTRGLCYICSRAFSNIGCPGSEILPACVSECFTVPFIATWKVRKSLHGRHVRVDVFGPEQLVKGCLIEYFNVEAMPTYIQDDGMCPSPNMSITDGGQIAAQW